MIKGVQRQTVLLRTPENRYFEAVQFLLRAEQHLCEEDEGEILREANRILEECGLYSDRKRRKRKRGGGLLLLLLGIFFGSGTVALLWLLLTLL